MDTSGNPAGDLACPEAGLVTIILVSHNSVSDLDACLRSIQRHVSSQYEVILVDNHSSDGTVEYVQSRYKWVHIVKFDSNVGFAKGNNVGVEHAKGEYLLLLNCDTILLTDIQAAITILNTDANVGIVGARMYSEHGELRASTGHFPTPWRLWKFTLQWSKPLEHAYGDSGLAAFQHDWVEGSFLLTSRRNWFDVGGLNNDAFMYAEDIEFCAQTRRAGRLTVQCAKVMYIHFGGYTGIRLPYLYAGYRRFHASLSSPATQRRADRVLLGGLIVRVIIFGVLSALTQDAVLLRRYRDFVRVLRQWRSLSPPRTVVPFAAPAPLVDGSHSESLP